MAPDSKRINPPPRLLLPHFQTLTLAAQPNGWQVLVVPDWIKRAMGFSPDASSEHIVPEEIDRHLPGFLEVLEKIRETRRPIEGYQTTIQSEEHDPTPVGIDAVWENQAGKPDVVSLTIRELFSSPTPPHLETQQISFFGMVGKSPGILRVFNKIRLYGAVEAPVLILGETGAGKEKVAEALHFLSRRKNGPFVAVNCSAISETLFESELFGHEKGSFTGAMKTHKGRFERAHNGTLFLDEMGDLPPPVQTKLLRVLETSSFERVGGEQPLKVDVRIVAATNKHLEREISQNHFRADLFYRISALQIFIPPLRERTEDIPLLVNHFITDFNRKYQRQVVCMSPEALHLLQQYQWPGNIRELRNLMERLFAENHTEMIGIKALREWYEERMRAADTLRYDPRVTPLPYRNIIELGMNHAATNGGRATGSPVATANPGGEVIEKADLTVDLIKEAFRKARGNITQAAGILGVHKATVYRFLKKYRLAREDLERQDP